MSQLQPKVAELAAGNQRLAHFASASEFDPTRFVTLCSEALRTRDSELLDFANKVM
jgi:hypothetical protein